MNAILIFTIATIVNVILSTVRSLLTINGNKWVSALANAVCYGFYTYVVVLTVSDINLWVKIGITALANFVGVWIVKFIEEKARKDKLWKLEVAVPNNRRQAFESALLNSNISYSWLPIGKYLMFNCYCYTQKETIVVRDAGRNVGAKFSAYESKSVV